MKIRTQFIITMLLFDIILVIIVASAIITTRLAGKASEQEKIASSIAQGSSELSYLSNDYLIYREGRQLSRWQSRFASFSSQVARLNVDKPEQQVLVRNIQANQRRLKEVFESVVSAVGYSSLDQRVDVNPAFLQVSWSRMAVQSQGLVSDASRLSQLLRQQMDQLRNTRNILMYVMAGLFGAFLLVSYMLTYRRILKSIATLQAGTAVIGSGNLDFVIKEMRNDEIGDLSRAFNKMTTNLKDVTASKSELEREITERKKAEEAMHEAHERAVWLSRFPEQNPNPVMRASANGTVLYCNPVSAKIPGWRCEVGQLLQNELLPLFNQAMEEGKELQWDVQIEGRFYFVWITPFPGEGYANVYGRDITGRKLREQRIVRLTKLYSVLSRVNETIVRTHDEERLYKEVCRIIAEEGEFPLVWVGQVKERQVAPIASHGPATDYLKEIRVEVDGELGNGPTGTCIREDRSVVNEDFDSNSSTAPWRKPALRYAFRASAAFPVHRQGRVVSALTLYSPEPGAFDTEQVNLLEALCADISYALDAMQEEKFRTEAENALRQRTLELQQLTKTLEQRVRERTEELEEANKALRQLSIRILSAHEEERERVAGELHDTIGAYLGGIKFKVESTLQQIAMTPKIATESLNTIIPVIQEAVEECRRIQMDLRPSMLDDLGVLPTLSWFCRRFQTIYSGIRVNQEVTIEESEVPVSLKIVIYRVTQEAMNNSAKHSKPNICACVCGKLMVGWSLWLKTTAWVSTWRRCLPRRVRGGDWGLKV